MILIYLLLTLGIAFLIIEIIKHFYIKIDLICMMLALWLLIRSEKNKREAVALRKDLRDVKRIYKSITFFPK